MKLRSRFQGQSVDGIQQHPRGDAIILVVFENAQTKPRISRFDPAVIPFDGGSPRGIRVPPAESQKRRQGLDGVIIRGPFRLGFDHILVQVDRRVR